MAKTPPHAHPDTLRLYEALVAASPHAKLKGATVPHTSVNGNMTSYLSKEGKLCEAYGVVQKEYVEVPDALLAKTAELKPFFDAGYAYVAALKPKPTAKKKSAKKAR